MKFVFQISTMLGQFQNKFLMIAFPKIKHLFQIKYDCRIFDDVNELEICSVIKFLIAVNTFLFSVFNWQN